MGERTGGNELAAVDYGGERSVLIFADSAAARDRVTSSAALVGARVAGIASISEGVARLERQAAVDAIWIELDGSEGGALDILLDDVGAGADALRYRAVVNSPHAMIDAVAARTLSHNVRHLCRPSDLERITALALAAAPADMRLSDVRRDHGIGRLQQLSEEVGRIAHILATLSSEDELASAPKAEGEEEPVDAGQIRAVIRARRLRDQFFQSDFFADPAWDMLLDLMAARVERQRVAVSSLCIAAAVPPTTALRWIKTLTDHGIFVRRNDPRDGRRVYLELSDRAAAGMTAYFNAAQRLAPFSI